MTQVFNDTVETELTIGGTEWLIVEAIVELSKAETPNYADVIIIPNRTNDTDYTRDKLDSLLGDTVTITADNRLISERITDASEDNLLFTGNLANISPTGRGSYEALIYDPSQQAFAPENDGGSLKNTTISIPSPSFQYDAFLFNIADGVSYEPPVIKADEIVKKCVDALNLPSDKYEIELSDSGTQVGGETYAINQQMTFNSHEKKVKEALEQCREKTKSEWWFDKEGVFHFGVPEPTRHELRYITDTSAGKTTPPYQSIQVIGSGIASQSGYEQDALEVEDKIVKQANIVKSSGEDGFSIQEIGQGRDLLQEPTFTYKNLSISTDEQAINTLKSLAKDIGAQQAEGKVTVVGFPEVEIFDGIVMPQTDSQPMGGFGYGVYRVTHFLNPDDGFLTEIEVSGVSGITRPSVIETELPTRGVRGVVSSEDDSEDSGQNSQEDGFLEGLL